MQLEVWSEYFIRLELKMSVFIALSIPTRAPLVLSHTLLQCS